MSGLGVSMLMGLGPQVVKLPCYSILQLLLLLLQLQICVYK